MDTITNCTITDRTRDRRVCAHILHNSGFLNERLKLSCSYVTPQSWQPRKLYERYLSYRKHLNTAFRLRAYDMRERTASAVDISAMVSECRYSLSYVLQVEPPVKRIGKSPQFISFRWTKFCHTFCRFNSGMYYFSVIIPVLLLLLNRCKKGFKTYSSAVKGTANLHAGRSFVSRGHSGMRQGAQSCTESRRLSRPRMFYLYSFFLMVCYARQWVTHGTLFMIV